MVLSRARGHLPTETEGLAGEDAQVLLLIHLSARAGGGRGGGLQVVGPWQCA